ncbi:MAG: ATP synthase F1 subunit delta [Chitinophagaceae bacterium]|nr:MAG: ATP synthase F1 subunit delta [Chitinophagaceae bacterium]
MHNPRLAGRYAKSLIGLAIERNELDKVYGDMLYMQSLINQSSDFAMLLKSPVISPDKKITIINSIVKNNVSEMVAGFNKLLISKGRESNLPEIIGAFIEQYKVLKNIFVVKLTTAIPASEELKATIVEKVKQTTAQQNIELETEVDEDLIGGFVLQMGDTLVDASIQHDLNVIKKQFTNKDFVFNIR